MAQQAIEHDERGVGGDDVGALGVRDERAHLGQRHEPVPGDFAVLARRDEVRGQPQVVDEDRLALQPVRLLAADADRAGAAARAPRPAARCPLPPTLP